MLRNSIDVINLLIENFKKVLNEYGKSVEESVIPFVHGKKGEYRYYRFSNLIEYLEKEKQKYSQEDILFQIYSLYDELYSPKFYQEKDSSELLKRVEKFLLKELDIPIRKPKKTFFHSDTGETHDIMIYDKKEGKRILKESLSDIDLIPGKPELDEYFDMVQKSRELTWNFSPPHETQKTSSVPDSSLLSKFTSWVKVPTKDINNNNAPDGMEMNGKNTNHYT